MFFAAVEGIVQRTTFRKAEFIEPMECALVSTLPEGPGAFLGYSDREIPQASGRPSGTVDVVEEPTEF